MKRIPTLLAFALALSGMSQARAEGWCDLAPGWSVVTHGTRAENVFILGRFQGAPNDIWMQIADANVGKANVAVALAAQLGGRTLSLYLDAASATCANYGSWQSIGTIRHVRLVP